MFTVQFPADLITFTAEIFNGNLHLLCKMLLAMTFSKQFA